MAVIGASPVTFISESTQPGKQYQIPLTAITIETTGIADCTAWISAVNVSGADQNAVIPTLLSGLLAQGLISKPPS